MPIPVAIVMPLAFVRVIPSMVFVKALLTRISQIAAPLFSLLAVITVVANGLIEIGFSFLQMFLALCSILGVHRLNRYRSNQNRH